MLIELVLIFFSGGAVGCVWKVEEGYIGTGRRRIYGPALSSHLPPTGPSPLSCREGQSYRNVATRP
jgi:hypothetical protein